MSSILLPSGRYNSFSQAMLSGAVPTFLSTANWSDEAKGFPQQTFLGASIRSFTMQGGFGDNSSSLSVDLVVDEYNKSDNTSFGVGDDVYHSGSSDNFVPPIPGSPVFFKFGPNFATVQDAFLHVFNELYYNDSAPQLPPQSAGSATIDQVVSGLINLPANSYVSLTSSSILNYSQSINNPATKGAKHITFGGILQNYNQNRSPGGNPLYSVNVIDPREILSNVTLILNNYAGPTYEQPNVMNLYGFLEYNPTDATKNLIRSTSNFEHKLSKTVNPQGEIFLNGDDKYYSADPTFLTNLRTQIKNQENAIAAAKRQNNNYSQIVNLSDSLRGLKAAFEQQKRAVGPVFPITGTGFSRRSSQGIPYYRIQDAINALMEYYSPLPPEYKDQGFGGRINFRGFNYVVDFSGLPDLPEFYYLDFDEINLLELALEICDITNRDLFVSLLPVINHSACANLFAYNNNLTANNVNSIIAGIIRLDTIDRSDQPFYGAIKTYIDSLATRNIYVENQDLGYELSNISTDKFIVGAQEVETHFFSSNADRDILAFKQTNQNGLFPNKPEGYQWTLEASLEQQILPYYGKLGQHAVTIPKGFGSYQQILLDATSLNAAGVGSYYVATEMELRCALISFDRWKDFLRQYNDVYMESIESDDTANIFAASMTPQPLAGPPLNLDVSNKYAVTVPRSVFDTYAITPYDANGLPSSPCNPPYGYPLYYKRMTQIGIPEAGLSDLFNRWSSLNTNLTQLKFTNRTNAGFLINSEFQRLQAIKDRQGLTPFETQYYTALKQSIGNGNSNILGTIAILENIVKNNGKTTFPILPKLATKNNQNALKVYNFVRSVAEECLGKKFLVKIPKEVNVYYENAIVMNTQGEYTRGPFGFRPRSTRNIAGYEFSTEFRNLYVSLRNSNSNMMQSFLSSGVLPNPTQFAGPLRINFNPLSEKYESNYTPSNLGGYFNFDLYQNTLGVSSITEIRNANFNQLPIGVQQGLIPQDLTNFLNEDGRISAYVRFDNSQDLTLEGLNDGDFTQQIVVGNYMIPDLVQALDNTGPDEFHAFPNFDQGTPNSSTNNHIQMAFVKCSVEENLFMPPKIKLRQVAVHGQFVTDVGQKSMPNKIFIPCSGIEDGAFVAGTGVWVDSINFYLANYVPNPQAGQSVNILDFDRFNPSDGIPGGASVNNSFQVVADLDKLNTDHVYALITLPNRVIPTKDARFRDGMNQSMTAEKFKHLMTMDVVRGLPGFNLPTAPMNKPPYVNLTPAELRNTTSSDVRIRAWLAMKKAQKQLSFGFPQQVNAVSPSPVYPDLVALPLLSNDRCYGPWVSSQLDGQAYILKNIGGRVDFIKDESLSPWNYGGYFLMDKAGRLQAEFSNSLLLFSERGSFTVPTIPESNSLCRSLVVGGPLVTSINVDVSTGGARTTYQMDLYTSSFGKLQKQKQDEISKISRERKKLTNERNSLIKKGLGKKQVARNFNKEYKSLARGGNIGNETGLGMMNTIAASVNSETRSKYSPSLGGSASGPLFGSNGSPTSQTVQTTEYNSVASIQSDKTLAQTAQMFTDALDLAGSYYKSASANIDQIFAPYSNGYHGIMSYRPNSTISANQSLLYANQEIMKLEEVGVVQYGGYMQ